MEKRESCRAIIIDLDKIVLMYREKNNRVYYTYPGGGKEKDESLEQCVIREAKEEFGINIEPLREIYLYEDEKTIQHYFICNWKSGTLGTGEGEEFSKNGNRGIYVPVLAEIQKINEMPIMPPEVTMQLFQDIKKYGKDLEREKLEIKGKH